MGIKDLKENLAYSCNILANEGHWDNILGHVTVRIPNTNKALMKPHGFGFEEIRPRHIITVDIETGKKIEGKYERHSEVFIHTEILKARPDVNSVVHTHQPLATAFSVAGVPLLPIYNQAAPFAPETPIFPSPRLITTVQDGTEVARTLGDRMAMLLQGHGIIMVGDSLEYATVHAIYLERTAYMQWIASSVGKPVTMPQKEIDIMRENMVYRAYDAFNYFLSLLPGR